MPEFLSPGACFFLFLGCLDKETAFGEEARDCEHRSRSKKQSGLKAENMMKLSVHLMFLRCFRNNYRLLKPWCSTSIFCLRQSPEEQSGVSFVQPDNSSAFM